MCASAQDAAVKLASDLLWAAHPDALPLCQLAQSTLAVVDSRIASLLGPGTASAATSSAPGSAPAAAQPHSGLQSALQLLGALTAAMAEARVLSTVAEAAVASLGRAVVALSGLPAESQTAETVATATEAAAIVADLVTGYPMLLDQHPELLASLSRCAGAEEAVTRCVRAYVACVPAAALEARTAAAAAKRSTSSAVPEARVCGNGQRIVLPSLYYLRFVSTRLCKNLKQPSQSSRSCLI